MKHVAPDHGLRIGELAGRAGLTVRTLHHYDQIGLVRASDRTDAGHRRYSEADIRRLYQVVALRSSACCSRGSPTPSKATGSR
ncbi:MAG: MerR family transcriptional regulator [Actinomycetota bacterium]